jgi:hypothetical protein
MSWKRVRFLSSRGESVLNSSMTLNLNNSMSYSDINAKIDMLPRYIPLGQAITVQFADGTYTLGGALVFANFWGPGSLVIQGNTGETSGLHTTQAVILSTVAAKTYGTYLYGLKCYTFISKLRIDVSTADGQTGIWLQESDSVIVAYSYLKGNGTGGGGYMVYNYLSKMFVQNTYIDNSYCAFLNHIHSVTACIDNSSTVNSQYGRIGIGATFSSFTGTQPGYNAAPAYQQGAQGG